jgi:hypothetical protein
MNGNWAALKAASDESVYMGLACHGCNGHLVYYDSTSNKMVDVGDLAELTGEDGLDIGPPSKIHAEFWGRQRRSHLFCDPRRMVA